MSTQQGLMSKLRFHISMSLDGYVAGRNRGRDDPLGEGGLDLHDWFAHTRMFKTKRLLRVGPVSGTRRRRVSRHQRKGEHMGSPVTHVEGMGTDADTLRRFKRGLRPRRIE
jgi:hypothetical protein